MNLLLYWPPALIDQLERENVKVQEAYAFVAMGPLECPAKAAEFDRQHSGARYGRHHAGAKELAQQYTAGELMCRGRAVARARD